MVKAQIRNVSRVAALGRLKEVGDSLDENEISEFDYEDVGVVPEFILEPRRIRWRALRSRLS